MSLHSSPTLRTVKISPKTSEKALKLSPLYSPTNQSTNPSLDPSINESLADQKRQSISQSIPNQSTNDLKRVLRWPDLLMLGIGCTIGSGIFVVTGEVASSIAGPAVFLSFVFASFACLFAAFCYAEFASIYTGTSGSAYQYTKATMGPLIGWLIGWDLVLEYIVSGAAVAKGWSKHLQQILNMFQIDLIPERLLNGPFNQSMELTGSLIDLPAVFITFALTYVLLQGIQSSKWVNNVMVVLKLGVIMFVLIAGFPLIDWSHFSPLMPYGFSSLTIFGHTLIGQSTNGEATGVIAGASIVFFSYVGFDSVSTCARECVNPSTDLPIGLIGSLLVSTLLYVGVSIVLVGMVPYQLIDPGAPFSAAFESFGMSYASTYISIGALTGITSVMFVTMLGAPRLLMAMANDRFLPASFRDINASGTPSFSTSMTCLSIAMLSGFLPQNILIEMVSLGTLFAFVMVCICVLKYRYTHPFVVRPFWCPWSPFVPLMGVLMCSYLMLSLPFTNWLRLIGWLTVGLMIYVLYGEKRYRDGDQYVQVMKQEMEDPSINQSIDQSIDDDLDLDGLIEQWSDDDEQSINISMSHAIVVSDEDALDVSRMND